MSFSMPKAIFIQQSDEGTDVFFLEHVGVYQDGVTKTEVEWNMTEKTHIPSERALDLFTIVRQVTRIEPPVELSPEEPEWFVHHETVEE